MKAVTRRLVKLEDRFWAANKPRRRLRIVVWLWGIIPNLEPCTRTLCSDGTLLEVIRLDRRQHRDHEPTDEEIERWADTFPIRGLQCWPGMRP